MNKKLLVVIVVAVLVLGGGAAWMLHGNSSKSDSMNNMDMSKSDTPANNSNSTTPTATNSVTIQNFAFSPASITVKKGTTVTWTNKDSTPHTVTQDEAGGPGMDSKGLAQGETYSATFNTTGTFKYHCAFHSNMTGTVTVTD